MGSDILKLGLARDTPRAQGPIRLVLNSHPPIQPANIFSVREMHQGWVDQVSKAVKLPALQSSGSGGNVLPLSAQPSPLPWPAPSALRCTEPWTSNPPG